MGYREPAPDFHHDAVAVFGAAIAGRSWHAHADGTLSGITYRQPWVRGTNTAWCPYSGAEIGTVVEQPADWLDGNHRSSFTIGRHAFAPAMTRTHKPGALGCSCGWWAYTDRDLTPTWGSCERRATSVAGVVRLWGRMTRGTKGYRAQYAEIQALIEPSWVDDTEPGSSVYGNTPRAEIWERVVDKYAAPVLPTIDAAFAAVRSLA